MFGDDDQDQNKTQDGQSLSSPVTTPSEPTDSHSFGSSDLSAPSTAVVTDNEGTTASAPTVTPPTLEGSGTNNGTKQDDRSSSDSDMFIATPAPNEDEHPMPVGGTDGDLLNIKQQALQQLTPLIGHLNQTPEEQFKTTMMMIQASDDQSLIKAAYEAAQKITDDKAKAQALLDIVNEINYFSQQQG